MRVGTLYSGIGGADVGFSAAGWTVVFQAEKDAFRRAVLEKHWPDVDYRAWSVEDVAEATQNGKCGGVPEADVLYGELPDKDIERWWPPFFDVATRLHTTWVCIECSPSVPIDVVLRDFALEGWWFRLMQGGITLQTSSLPATDWHVRQRLFITASRDRAKTDGLTQRGFSTKMELDLGRLTAPPKTLEFFEQSIGFKPRWTCVCRGADSCSCPAGDRISALRDATPPHLAFWLAHFIDGRWSGVDIETDTLEAMDQTTHAK